MQAKYAATPWLGRIIPMPLCVAQGIQKISRNVSMLTQVSSWGGRCAGIIHGQTSRNEDAYPRLTFSQLDYPNYL